MIHPRGVDHEDLEVRVEVELVGNRFQTSSFLSSLSPVFEVLSSQIHPGGGTGLPTSPPIPDSRSEAHRHYEDSFQRTNPDDEGVASAELDDSVMTTLPRSMMWACGSRRSM